MAFSTTLQDFGHETVQANGLQFHVATCEPQSTPGVSEQPDRLALFLHGFPERWSSWKYQMPLLARLGYRVWAPDLRGYGDTDRPPRQSDYAIEKLVDDVAGLIDASGAKQTLLLAHDWGAMIAWVFAIRRIRELEGLVIMNVPHPGAASKGWSWRQMLRSWYAVAFQIPGLPERLLSRRAPSKMAEGMRSSMARPENLDADSLRLLAENWGDTARISAMLNYYREYVKGGGAKRQTALGYPAIDTRTLMLWGVNDVALTVETTYATSDFVTDLTLRYLPEASHWVQQDEPLMVNQMLEAWISDEPVPRAPGEPNPAHRGCG